PTCDQSLLVSVPLLHLSSHAHVLNAWFTRPAKNGESLIDWGQRLHFPPSELNALATATLNKTCRNLFNHTHKIKTIGSKGRKVPEATFG
ncbi:unnamed protein product, partial [Protopolystoma xenopodis]